MTDRLDGTVTEDVIAELPRLRVVHRRLPTSGMSYWDGQAWVIAVNSAEPLTRQRFTLLHEFKHVMDHGQTERLYGGAGSLAEQRAEQVCDYFAGCVLMPKLLVKRAWGSGLQSAKDLAGHFDVSERAVEVRLAQLGLSEPVDRCDAPPRGRQSSPPRRHYYRARSLHWPLSRSLEVAV